MRQLPKKPLRTKKLLRTRRRTGFQHDRPTAVERGPLRIAFTHNLQTERVETQAEFDTLETVHAIASDLRSLGHRVYLVEVSVPISRLLGRLQRLKPDLIFNTAEGFRGRCREAFYPALFEQLDIPYTGSDAYVCTVTLDKNLTKRILAGHGVRTPRSVFVTNTDGLADHGLRFPLILKPNFEGSSIGITNASIVETEAELRARAAELLRQHPAGLLVEEYIDGIDVVVPFLEGASRAPGGVLEPASYAYCSDTERRYKIYDFDRKMNGFSDLVVEIPAKISSQQRIDALQTSKTIVEALGIRDVARIDYRLDSEGRLHFLEINALPSLEAGASIYDAATLAGLPTPAHVLAAIVDTACRRHGIAPESCKTELLALAPAI